MEKTVGRRVYRRGRGQRTVLGEREKRRLGQLGVSLLLFVTVLFAKGADRLGVLRGELKSAILVDANFQTAFTDLGWSVAEKQPVWKTLLGLWDDVFLPKERFHSARGSSGLLSGRTSRDLSEDSNCLLIFTPPDMSGANDPMADSGSRTKGEDPSQPEPAVVYMNYTGPALPDNTTMDKYALYLSETMDPVKAVESSGYGWREHPINGKELFHYGVDLVVDTGTPVQAFAAGKVDYIGESDIYGQYLQLDHGNGIKSFYAHCSKLCVRQGQLVAMGDKVAESGATGDVTGPHLHFELKRQGVWLNPNYYIQPLT